MSTSDIVVQEPECVWGYTGEHGPADWGTMCQEKYPLCSNGTTQSPIDVTSWNVVTYTQNFLQLQRWSPETLSWYISCISCILIFKSVCMHAYKYTSMQTKQAYKYLFLHKSQARCIEPRFLCFLWDIIELFIWRLTLSAAFKGHSSCVHGTAYKSDWCLTLGG